MPATRTYIQQNRAAWFDWLVIGISFSLGFVFPSLSDFIQSPGFFNWMLAALLLYTAGAALKHFPLSYRLSRSAQPVQPVPYLVFLIVGHWIIIYALVVLAEPAIRHLLRLPPLNEKTVASAPLLWSAAAIAFWVTWLVYRTKSGRKKVRDHNERILFRQELVADIFLVAGVSIISFVCWEKGVMAMLSRASAKTIGDIWFLFVFLAVLFLFFYLPLRYLFFMENPARSGNRKRLFLVFGFLLLRALIEMIGASVTGKHLL